MQAYVKEVVHGKAEYQKIKYTKSFFELEEVLLEHVCSWFNYEIIAEMRKEFLRLKDDHVLEDYIKDFNAYCERCCFRSPETLHPDNESNPSFIFKIEKDFYTSTLAEVVYIKRTIAKIVGCPPHSICICLLYTSPSPRDATLSRMPSSA